jgi:hypothetical protein
MRWIEKLMIILALTCFLQVPEVSAADPYIINYIKTDSTHIYSWNAAESLWIPSSVQLYTYNAGKVIRIVTLDYTTRYEQSKTEYSYNTAGFADTITNYSFNNGWTALTRNVVFYDLQQRITEIWIQKWTSGIWTNDRKQNNYIYDEFDRLLEFQSIYWRSNIWTQPSIDYSYYDAQGKLIRREAFNPNGSLDYQVICNYDGNNLLSEMYAQYPSGTGWQKWWLVNYQYDGCGFKISQIQYAGSGTEWVPSTKTVNFSYFKPELYPDPKVRVCHNGHTIYISKKALQSHLNHGDCLGSCPETKCTKPAFKRAVNNVLSEVPFTIFPNPASERITIKPNGYNAGISKVDILDMNGNFLRSKTVSNSGEVTIERGGLISGQYILRIHGEQTYNLIVVFN